MSKNASALKDYYQQFAFVIILTSSILTISCVSNFSSFFKMKTSDSFLNLPLTMVYSHAFEKTVTLNQNKQKNIIQVLNIQYRRNLI